MIKTETVSVKKLKKDGSLDATIIASVARSLSGGKTVLMPVDGIYGVVSTTGDKTRAAVEHATGLRRIDGIRMVSSFKMLDGLATVSKMEYDFLHRIWPGEPVVIMKESGGDAQPVRVRMPRGKYLQDIIEHVGHSLHYAPLLTGEHAPVYRKKDLVDLMKGHVDTMLVIDEFCKEHGWPTLVDISDGGLTILNEGRVSAEEVKSLYFLGKDDAAL